MTTEEKASRYNEIIERARKEYKNHKAFKGFREMLERIFPEQLIKESEDERIKETLIKYFKERQKDGDKDELFCGLSYDIILVWLEKQTFDFKIELGNWYKCLCDYALPNGELEFKYNNLYYCSRDWRLHGEIDTRNVKNIGVKGYKAFFRPATNQEIQDWLKKQDKQKLDDNVGPKFHEGDWVVFNNRPEGSIYQVEKIENYEYILRHFLGGSMPLSFSHENMIRLWTVDDAHEGDVLAHDDGSLTIFGHRLRGIDSGLYMAHVLLTYNIEFKQTCATANVHPATKEERDILFAKIKEEGYEWDARKKELKRVGQKSAWSEEDTKHFMRCKGYIEAYVEPRRDDVEWFKSLKDRVQPQPKQEWTKEDEKMLSNIVDCIKNLPIFYESLNINGEDKTTEQFICDAINWLKSIEGRVQPKQEWSEEDLCRIEHALFGTYAVDFATRLLYKIKSLNSQNTWRPSDEQIEEFKDLLNDINWEGEILVSLYNDLKKLREE